MDDDLAVAYRKLARLGGSQNDVLQELLKEDRVMTKEELMDNLKLTEAQVRNSLSRLKRKNFIKAVERGEYKANLSYLLLVLLYKRGTLQPTQQFLERKKDEGEDVPFQSTLD